MLPHHVAKFYRNILELLTRLEVVACFTFSYITSRLLLQKVNPPEHAFSSQCVVRRLAFGWIDD